MWEREREMVKRGGRKELGEGIIRLGEVRVGLA